MAITTKGKATAVKALEARRKVNKKIKRIDNGSLYAGSPMYFYCLSCGGTIVVPENYLSKPSLCVECSNMKELGWLE